MKKYSVKFWIIFWLLSFIFLTGWFLFWNIFNKGISSTAESALKIIPMDIAKEKEYIALGSIADFFVENRNQEKTLMVLFQNNMEIRPGGGFIGSFAIVRIKNGKITSMETHDLSNFDRQIPNVITPPYPLAETGVADFWKLRDSNFSPDFAVNAKKAEEFYHMGGGQEELDAVIGITTNVLTSVLKITGPISIDGYPGSYDSENAVLSLEYQVEKAFEEQGIDRGERKSVMSDLATEIEKRVLAFNILQKIQLTRILLVDLNRKDIQMNFKEPNLQKDIISAQWAGTMDEKWGKDYLLTLDANLGSFKSDYYVRRRINYSVDLSKDLPIASLKISYEHTAKQKDWMTRNYTDYLRVYVPMGSELVDQKNFDDTKFGREFNKNYFGSIVRVPIGTSKTVEINYALPKSLKDDYELKIQKQAGLNDVPFEFHLIKPDGTTDGFSNLLNGDMVFK